MSDDLVKRLRSKIIVHTDAAVWMLEAAARIEELETNLTDMEALMAAADALADAVDNPDQSAGGLYHYRWHRIDDALTVYRAAREAVTRGTPPAFATSA